VVDAQRELSDRSGQSVRLLGKAGQILHSLRHESQWVERETIVAWVSCTDEPAWADECLRKFKSTPTPLACVAEPVPLLELAHSSQIYKANKGQHMRRLQQGCVLWLCVCGCVSPFPRSHSPPPSPPTTHPTPQVPAHRLLRDALLRQ
jgi:hypothetical protein